MPSARRFPPPWIVDEATTPASSSATRTGRHWPTSTSRTKLVGSAAHLLSKDEARRIAANIAKLPELLRRTPPISEA